jgi:hypothetical protein
MSGKSPSFYENRQQGMGILERLFPFPVFIFCLYILDAFFNLIFGIGLIAIRALVDFIRNPVIDQVIGKIDTMEPYGKIMKALEVLAFTGIA